MDPAPSIGLQPGSVAAPATAFEAGSNADFDRLYRTTYSRLLVLVTVMVEDQAAAEDCVQDAFVRAYGAWHTWRGDGPAEAWLYGIAVNVARSYRRWRRLRQAGELVRRLGRPNAAMASDHGLRAELVEALRRLPPEQSAALVLRHYHGHSNRDIARVLHVPESTVASRLAKAKERLRQELSED